MKSNIKWLLAFVLTATVFPSGGAYANSQVSSPAKLADKDVVIRTNGSCDNTYPVFDYVKIP